MLTFHCNIPLSKAKWWTAWHVSSNHMDMYTPAFRAHSTQIRVVFIVHGFLSGTHVVIIGVHWMLQSFCRRVCLLIGRSWDQTCKFHFPLKAWFELVNSVIAHCYIPLLIFFWKQKYHYCFFTPSLGADQLGLGEYLSKSHEWIVVSEQNDSAKRISKALFFSTLIDELTTTVLTDIAPTI